MARGKTVPQNLAASSSAKAGLLLPMDGSWLLSYISSNVHRELFVFSVNGMKQKEPNISEYLSPRSVYFV